MKTSDIEARLRRVRLVIFDVDGVLTDGAILLTDDGREMKRFNVHDGTGINYLQRAGLPVGILSGRRSRAVNRRARELDIKLVLQDCKVKEDGLDRILRRTGARVEEICYVGDDLPDVPVMRRVGLAVAPADAGPEVRAIAHWVTRARGGAGVAREVAERVLKAQKKWGGVIERYGLKPRARRTGVAP